VLHAHGVRGGIVDEQLRREYICYEIGVNPRDSLTKLNAEQIAEGDTRLKKLSNEQIAERFATWRDARTREQYSLAELLVLDDEFKREHPDAEALGMTLTDYLETRKVQL
jgi:hypothetical protein